MSILLGFPSTPLFTVHGAETTAPTAGTALATTPAASSAMNAVVMASFNTDDSVPTYEIAHRNAANSADLAVTYVPASAAPGVYESVFPLGLGETIVVRAKTNGTAGNIYQVDLYVWAE